MMVMRRLLGLGVGATFFLVATLGAGCSAEPEEAVVVRSGGSIVPGDTMKDWATYGDVVVQFTVVSEQEIAPRQEELERGEGVITRQVTVRQSASPVWKRPSRSTAAPKSPAEWKIADGGWVFKGSKRARLVDEGSVGRLEVGRTYLSIRTYSSIGGEAPQWFSLQNLPLENGSVRFAKEVQADLPASMASVQGMRGMAVAKLLNNTRPDARAIPYMKLDAFQRYQKVMSGT